MFSLLQLLLLLLFSFKCSYCRQTGLFFFLWRTYVRGCSAVVNTLLCACKLGRGSVFAGEMRMGRRRCLEVKVFTVPRFLFGGKHALYDVIIEKAEAKKQKVLGSSSSADKTWEVF